MDSMEHAAIDAPVRSQRRRVPRAIEGARARGTVPGVPRYYGLWCCTVLLYNVQYSNMLTVKTLVSGFPLLGQLIF